MNTPSRSSRNTIAAAALAEFAEHGFAGARVARIAERAHLNKQLVFYYFESKAQLYQTLMEESRQEFQKEYRASIAQSHRHATEQIRSLVSAMLSGLARRPHLLRLLMLDGRQDGRPRVTAEEFLADLEGSFARLISDGQGLGYFRDDIQPNVTAGHAVRLLVGHAAFQPVRSADDATSAEEISRLLLRSLAW